MCGLYSQKTYIIFQSYQGSIFTCRHRNAALLPQSFNPIKVLFLQCVWFIIDTLVFLNFQSYQGSIFTEIATLPWSKNTLDFQSYQGSIFTEWWKNTNIHYIRSFQSYQGSIFTSIVCCRICLKYYFQSYQGSIFTLETGMTTTSYIPLSILSRFYFYRVIVVISVCTWWLSILSRFYFYERRFQGSKRNINSFNPIKVLFLL